MGYGLFAAQRARSAPLTKKAFAGVIVSGGTATLLHPSHVTAVAYLGIGSYKVTFDRHLDNCSFSTALDFYGKTSQFAIFQLKNGPINGASTSDEFVLAHDSASQVSVDADFDIIALCPGT